MNSLITYIKNKFKYNPNKPYKGLDLLEKYVKYFHIMTSDSVEDYMNKKPSLRNRTISWLLNINQWIVSIRFFLIVLFNNNKNIKIILFDYMQVIERSDIIGVLFGILNMGFALGG